MSKPKILLLAGHGLRQNQTFDSGAIGLIAKGEHRYFAEDFFPAMKKYAPDNFVFHTAYNVFDRGNIVDLAKQHGDDTKVIEFHYDAAGAAARGGHVIVHSNFEPDALDLRLRDAIDSMVGVRYTHRGHRGFSGRNNLGNVNRTANGGVNYRLLEIGFGTNQTDANIMVNQVDEYAKRIVEAIINEDAKPQPNRQEKPAPATNQPNKSVSQAAQDVIDGKYGNNPERQQRLRNDGFDPSAVQREVNRLLSGNVTEPSPPQNINQVAQAVINGEYGNGDTRTQRLRDAGYDPAAVQQEVNRILSGGSTSSPSNRKSVDQVAREILNGQGNWGNGDTRVRRLQAAGYNAREVQNRVNQLASGNSGSSRSSSSNTQSIDQMARRIINDPQAPQGHDARRRWLGVDQATYNQVRNRVNQLI